MAWPPVLLLFLLLFRASSSFAATVNGKSKGGGEMAAVFIDAASHRYLRDQQLPTTLHADAHQHASLMSMDEVAAAVSVLLGFAPPTLFPADSSSKLNELLLPNPFDRPHAVFLLQVDGYHGWQYIDGLKSEVGNIFKTRVAGASSAAIGFSDKDEVVVIRSDESLSVNSGSAYLDSEITNLANWLGGSYQTTDQKLSLPLDSGSTLTLQIGKEADFEFASGLLSLLKTIKKGIQIHKDFLGGTVNPAELLVCHFMGIKALEDEYGSAGIVKQGAEVFQTALTKTFDSLQRSHEGKIVGLVIYRKEALPSSGSMIDVPSSLHISRWLEEATKINTTASELLLVRKSLAWITGIILLVSTLVGVCLLMNMPLTRDTLLYSNVKLD